MKSLLITFGIAVMMSAGFMGCGFESGLESQESEVPPTWIEMDSPTEYNLYDVWGSGEDDVFAVGHEGTIIHYDGTAWTEMASGENHYLGDIWGSSGSDIFVVGELGTILHYDGERWHPMESGTSKDLECVWGISGEDVYAGGYGTLLHYDGVTWSPVEIEPVSICRSIWGTAPDDIYVGCWDETIMHYDGADWTVSDYPVSWGFGGYGISAMWGSGSEFYTGVDGYIYVGPSRIDPSEVGQTCAMRFNGTDWVEVTGSRYQECYIRGLWGTANGQIYVAYSGWQTGFIGVIEDGECTTLETDISYSPDGPSSIWGSSASDIFVVGGEGQILHYGRH